MVLKRKHQHVWKFPVNAEFKFLKYENQEVHSLGSAISNNPFLPVVNLHHLAHSRQRPPLHFANLGYQNHA